MLPWTFTRSPGFQFAMLQKKWEHTYISNIKWFSFLFHILHFLHLVMTAICDGVWGVTHNFEIGPAKDNPSSSIWGEDFIVILSIQNMRIVAERKLAPKDAHRITAMFWYVKCRVQIYKNYPNVYKTHTRYVWEKLGLCLWTCRSVMFYNGTDDFHDTYTYLMILKAGIMFMRDVFKV